MSDEQRKGQKKKNTRPMNNVLPNTHAEGVDVLIKLVKQSDSLSSEIRERKTEPGKARGTKREKDNENKTNELAVPSAT